MLPWWNYDRAGWPWNSVNICPRHFWPEKESYESSAKIGRNLGILKRKKLLSDHQKAPQKNNRFFEWLARTIRAWIVSTSNRSTAQFLRICVPGPQFWRIDANKGFIFVLPVKVRRAEWEGKGAIENSRRKRGSESSAAVLFAKVSRRRIVSPVHIIIANADPPL